MGNRSDQPGHGAWQGYVRPGRCISGNWFDVSVRDSFAFDVDEAVDVEVEFFLPRG